MSVEVHLHVAEGITDDDLRNLYWADEDSDLFDPNHPSTLTGDVSYRALETPECKIGESAAGMCSETYEGIEQHVPETVRRVLSLVPNRTGIERMRVIDQQLIDAVDEAFSLPNVTRYEVGKRKKVIRFLKEHQGQRVYPLGW